MSHRCGSLLILALAASSLAQAPATPQQPTPAPPTLRTGVQLVVVDVVVTDKSGNPIHNLKADDFALLENDVSQQFKSFDEHVGLSLAEAMRLPPVPKLPPGIFTNFAVGPETGPLNILLLDRLNTPVGDQMFMQQQVNEYLKTANPGVRMAVFGLTDHLMLLQGFTSNPEVLKAAVNKTHTKASVLMDEAAGNANSSSQLGSDISSDADLLNGSTTPSETTLLLQQFETQNESFQLQLRAKYTLDALNLLARYLSAFPGRKNLIWFSGSFPVNIMPDPDAADSTSLLKSPFTGVASSEKEFRETTALLSRSQTAVYPIGAKGLEGNASMDATVDQTQSESMLRHPKGVASALAKDSANRFDEHSTMYMMADDTGGKATVDNNGLAKAVADDIQNGSNYYTIAYSPTDPKLDGGFRSIKVKLKDQNYTLNYRRGYFADDTGATGAAANPSAPTLAPGASASNAMGLALIHGSPAPTQVIFSTRVQPLGTKAEEYPAPGNRPGKNAKSPFRRYRIDYVISPSELHFTVTPDGNHHETLEFVTHVYDGEGTLINEVVNSFATNIPPPAYAQFQKSGVPYTQEVSVPDKGEYYLRIALRDVDKDRVGAVEIPVVNVRNLPPGPQPKPAPAPAGPGDSAPAMGGHHH